MESLERDVIEEDFEKIKLAFETVSKGWVKLDDYNKISLDNGMTGLSISSVNGKRWLVMYSHETEEYLLKDYNIAGSSSGLHYHNQSTYGKYSKITCHWQLAQYIWDSHSARVKKTRKNAKSLHMDELFDKIKGKT